MANNLQTKIESLAQQFAAQFAAGIVAAIRQAPSSELGAMLSGGEVPVPFRGGGVGKAGKAAKPKVTSSGRLRRRSPEELQAVLDKIVKALSGKGDGLNSEELQASLGMSKKEIAGVLALGLSNKALRKKGEKRATRYFAK